MEKNIVDTLRAEPLEKLTRRRETEALQKTRQAF